MEQERIIEKEKERDRYRERDQRDRDENREHKKKKKHKDDRRSHSNDSRKEKKNKRKHTRSPSESLKKHKKHHKEPKDSRDRRDKSRSKQREKRQRSRSDHKEKRSRKRSEQKDSKERLVRKQEKRDQRRDQKRDERRDQRKQQRRDQKKQEKRDEKKQQKKEERKDEKPQQKRQERYEQRIIGSVADFKRRQMKQVDEKDPYFNQIRQIEKVRRTDPEKADKMLQDLDKQMIFDRKQKQYETMKEKFREAQKQLQEAKREDHTILVYCLPLKARQKDIWNFFSKAECGKIRDIRIIRDQRSGKSKGVAYVEFYTSQAVEKSLTMKQRPIEVKGRQFTGLKIQHSQAEKNRAAAAAKQMKVTKQVDPYEQEREALKRQTKLQIRGLVGDLQNVDENYLREVFDPFGAIQFIDIHRDPATGKCKGFAFIQYENIKDAKQAVRELDGFELKKGHKISVSTVSYIQKGDASTGDDYLRSHGNKMALMNSLSRQGKSYSNLQRPPISTVPYSYLIMTNMFKMQGTSPEFFQKLKKDVQEACTAFGIVEKIFIEKNNQGNVWIKFSDTATAIKAQEKLNGQFFDNVKVYCHFATQETWNKRVSI